MNEQQPLQRLLRDRGRARPQFDRSDRYPWRMRRICNRATPIVGDGHPHMRTRPHGAGREYHWRVPSKPVNGEATLAFVRERFVFRDRPNLGSNSRQVVDQEPKSVGAAFLRSIRMSVPFSAKHPKMTHRNFGNAVAFIDDGEPCGQLIPTGLVQLLSPSDALAR